MYFYDQNGSRRKIVSGCVPSIEGNHEYQLWYDIKVDDSDNGPTLKDLDRYRYLFKKSNTENFPESDETDDYCDTLDSIVTHISNRSKQVLPLVDNYKLEINKFDVANVVANVKEKIRQYCNYKCNYKTKAPESIDLTSLKKELKAIIKLNTNWVFHTEISIIPLAEKSINEYKTHNRSTPIIALFSKNEVCWRCQIFLQALAEKTGSKIIVLSRHDFDRSMRAIKEKLTTHQEALSQVRKPRTLPKLTNVIDALKTMGCLALTSTEAINKIKEYDKCVRFELDLAHINKTPNKIRFNVIKPNTTSNKTATQSDDITARIINILKMVTSLQTATLKHVLNEFVINLTQNT